MPRRAQPGLLLILHLEFVFVSLAFLAPHPSPPLPAAPAAAAGAAASSLLIIYVSVHAASGPAAAAGVAAAGGGADQVQQRRAVVGQLEDVHGGHLPAGLVQPPCTAQHAR